MSKRLLFYMPNSCRRCMFFSRKEIHIGHGDSCTGNTCRMGYIKGEEKFDNLDYDNEIHPSCKLYEDYGLKE